mgnify:CR=1 FL=1
MFGYKEVAKAILQRQVLMKRYCIEGTLKERYHSFRLLNCAQGMAQEFYQLASISGLNILFPYLDSRLIKTALSMGESRFPYRILGTKIVLKDALRNYLPKKLVSRKKSAWGLPLLEAMAPGGVLHPLVKELEYSPFAASKPKVADAFLWSLLNFNIWRTQFFGTST